MAAATNCHKSDGLKQHTCILLKLWRSKVQNHYHWAEIKVLAGSFLLLGETSTEKPSLSLPASAGCSIPGLVATPLQSPRPAPSNLSLLQLHIASLLYLANIPLPALIRIHMVTFTAHSDNPISRSLT